MKKSKLNIKTPQAKSKTRSANKSESKNFTFAQSSSQQTQTSKQITYSSDKSNKHQSPSRNKSKSLPRTNPFKDAQKRRKAYKYGEFALKQIKYYQSQKAIGTIIPKLSFSKLVRQIANSTEQGFRWTPSAIHVIQTAAEQHMTGVFQDANLCSQHANRVTVMPRDLALVQRIRGLSKLK